MLEEPGIHVKKTPYLTSTDQLIKTYNITQACTWNQYRLEDFTRNYQVSLTD